MSANSIEAIGNFGIENVQIGEAKSSFPGGSGFRFALVASMFTQRIKAHSIVGRESAWNPALLALENNGVDVDGVKRVDDSVQFITQYDAGHNLEGYKIENAEIMPQIASLEIEGGLDSNTILHINPLDYDSQAKLVRLGTSKSSTVSMQMHHSSITPENRDKYLGLFSQVDMLFMTEAEAQLLTDNSILSESAEQISKEANGYVFITRGKQGVVVYQKGEETIDLPAIVVENPANLEGAGDAFAAGVISNWSNFNDIHKATRQGLMAANFSIQFSSPTEMIQFINKGQ